MLIHSAGQTLNAMEVTPAMMEPDNYYLVEQQGYDDVTGEVVSAKDIVWFSMARVPGREHNGKLYKTCRFCSCPAELLFSQMPGARFYGPVSFQLDVDGEDKLRTPEEETRQEGLGAILARAAKRTQVEG